MRAQARHLWRWCGTTEGKLFIALLIVALGIRLLIAPYKGFFGDNQIDEGWGVYLGNNFFHVYSAVGSYNDPLVYPPLMVYLFGLMDGVYALLVHLAGGQPVFNASQSPLLNILIKLPTFLADLGAVSLIYWLTRQVRSARWAFGVAASYALLPASLFDGALWGQTDDIVIFVVLLGLLCLWKQRSLWAGILFGLALALKPQPVFLLPVVLAYLWYWAGRREFWRAIIAMAGTVAVMCLPYIWPPVPEIFLYIRNVVGWSASTYTTQDAYNGWWILDPKRVLWTPYWGPITPATIGWALFLLVILLVVLGVKRDSSPKTLFLGAALLVMAFFTVTTSQHERYLYPALALLLVAALYDKRIYAIYAVASVTVFLNMALPVILSDDAFYQDAPQWRNFFTLHTQVTSGLQNGIAWAQVTLFISALAIYFLDLRRHPASSAQDAHTTPALLIASEEIPTSISQGSV